MRPTVSCCIIVKNESENLERLTKSLDGCVDQLCLTDTGSTDNTVELAKRLGWEVNHFDWVNDFSAARNHSFQFAKCDYVLWIDGDDVLYNQEEFKKWRDSAMSFSDYWIVPYHYAVNPVTKEPIVSFARERVVKRSLGMKWKYFLHEGILPASDTGQVVKTGGVSTWAIKHLRTEADLVKDKSRNLDIFERNKGNLDSRMSYYYGKELFEAQKPKESVEWFNKALVDRNLETHDRVLAIQYCAFSMMQLDKFNNAISLAHTGLELVPQRAEFLTLLGDGYLKQNRLDDSIPYYEAAKACVNKDRNQGQALSPLFSMQDLYTVYPRNQLARVYVHLGQLDKALKEARESEEYGSEEGKKIREEIEKLQKSQEVVKVKVPDVVFTCLGALYEWDEQIAHTRGMGGSEQACIQMARNIRDLTGRRVIVFNPREGHKDINGVEYVDHRKIQEYFSKYEPELHVAWRHNVNLTNAKTVVWAHDLIAPGCENPRDNVTVLTLSPFHKQFFTSMTGCPESKIEVTRNGIVLADFPDVKQSKADKPMVVFSSSPDRDLDLALRVMDYVVQEVPEVTFHCYYGVDNLVKMGKHEEAKKYLDMFKDRPWAIMHGNTEHKELLKQVSQAHVWLYPTNFLETFCITALEMLFCKVYPIVRNIGALTNTLSHAKAAGMATLIDHPAETESQIQSYAMEVIKAIKEESWKKIELDPAQYSWTTVATEWVNKWLQNINQPAQKQVN